MVHARWFLVGVFILGLSLVVMGADVQVSTVTGNSIEFDDQSGIATIEGNAVVTTSTGVLKADKIKVNTETEEGHAVGNVTFENAGGTLHGTEGHYNWKTSSGTIENAVGENAPWKFQAKHLEQVGQRVYDMEEGYITSCDLDPPHYKIKFKKSHVVAGKRAKLYRSKLALDDTPTFWTPFYTRSLVSKKYRLRIEPGHSSRDGTIVRTLFGYPVTPNSYTTLKWDYFQQTGNGVGFEHDYFAPAIKGNFNTYYIRDYNPDPRPQERRWSVLWNHFNKFGPRLTANGKLDFKSDQVFGQEFKSAGTPVKVESDVRGLLSELGLTYQFSKAALDMQIDRRDRFDNTVSSSSFISKLTLPKLSLNTIPLKYRYLPFYVSFSGNWTNETLTRLNPKQTLRYQRTGLAGLQANRDIKLGKKTTVTPTAGVQGSWRDRDFSISTGSLQDIYEGRYNAGLSLEHRITRNIEGNIGYLYSIRLEKNRLNVDHEAVDRGIELEQIPVSMVSRFGRSTRLSLSSGYDARQAPKDDTSKYQHEVQRITPPVADLQYEFSPQVNLYFRETYSLFNTGTQSILYTPANTSGEIQYGQISTGTYVTQGFSYAKTSPGAESAILFTNRLHFYLTPKWYVDAFISYRALGSGGMDYHKVKPVEKRLLLVRDMHCWVLRAEFSQSPDRSEAYFYIDLKTNLKSGNNYFNRTPDGVFGTPVDVSTVFPEPEPETPPQK